MRILYHPQVSMRSYGRSPKWLTSSDAQLNKMKAYVQHLPPSWEWIWLLPEGWQTSGSIQLPDNCKVWPTPHADNVLQERFNFPFRDLLEVYDDAKPNIVICEIPEHVRAWRVVQKTVEHHAPIVAMIEHVDFYEETDPSARVKFFLRQLDGALESDLVVFPLVGMKMEWLTHASHVLNVQEEWITTPPVGGVRSLGVKVDVWPGLFTPEEVKSQRNAGEALKLDVPVLFLISRLSDPSRTMYEEIIGASNDLYRNGLDHVLWVANPNGGRTWEWVNRNAMAYEAHPFGERVLERSEYLQLLWAADVVPIMYDLSRIYSIGACEAAEACCKILTARQKYPNYSSVSGYLVDRDRNEIAKGLGVLLGNEHVLSPTSSAQSYIEAHISDVKEKIMELVYE